MHEGKPWGGKGGGGKTRKRGVLNLTGAMVCTCSGPQKIQLGERKGMQMRAKNNSQRPQHEAIIQYQKRGNSLISNKTLFQKAAIAAFERYVKDLGDVARSEASKRRMNIRILCCYKSGQQGRIGKGKRVPSFFLSFFETLGTMSTSGNGRNLSL